MGNTKKSSNLYKINDIFYSIQAEGFNIGIPAIFIRFSNCNLRCDFCDTEFLSGIEMNISEILNNVENFPSKQIIFTGGEPLLQDTTELAKKLSNEGYKLCVETNGMFEIKHNYFNWITVSPKNDRIKIKKCNEVKCVIGIGEIPNYHGIKADYYFISPKNPTHNEKIGTESANFFDVNVAKYCHEYVKNNPKWRLTLQTNKIIGTM